MKIADFFTFTRIFHARRRRGTPRASDASCVSAVERPRERLPCRPPGRLRAGAPLQPASWPYRLSSLLSKLFPFIRAAAVGRSRPAESSTSLFDRLGVTSSTGTSQVSSAQRIPRRAAALLEKISGFCCGFCNRSALFSFHGGAEHPQACADAVAPRAYGGRETAQDGDEAARRRRRSAGPCRSP